jgi:hypothetical protein
VCRRHRTIPCHGTAQLVVIDGRVCAMPTTEHAPTCNDLHLMCEGDGEDQVRVCVCVCVFIQMCAHIRISYILLIVTLLQPIHISKVVVATKRSNSGGRGSRNGSSGVSRRRRSRTARVCVCVFCYLLFLCVLTECDTTT